MTPASIIVGPPTISAPALISWLPFEKLDRALRRIASDAYCKQRYGAERRDIHWLFTLRSWWTVWAQSGRWEQRGLGMGRYVMARLGPDKGDYEPSNVRIITHEENVRERSPEVHLAAVRRRTRRKSWRTNVVAAIKRRFAEARRRRAEEASP